MPGIHYHCYEALNGEPTGEEYNRRCLDCWRDERFVPPPETGTTIEEEEAPAPLEDSSSSESGDDAVIGAGAGR